MSKRVNNIFYEKLKFRNMLEAYERAAKGKKDCQEVIKYEMNLANNITETLKQLYNNQYRVGKYREFLIYEPKKRVIQSLPFVDRVIQQWYVEEFIKPIFVPKFIEDTYACIDGRGVHKAVKKFSKYMYNFTKENPDCYILKCDISKFFYSINKEKLMQIITKKVKDERFLGLTKKLIYHNREPVGIPIGNYTSQYFANVYMNEVDHFVKEKLKVKCYVRYMDDFILLTKNKEEAKEILNKVRQYLKENLGLELNKKTNYFKAKQGVIFCGYKIYKDHILLKKENKKKIYKKVKVWNELYDEKNLDLRLSSMQLNSWMGHAKNCDAYRLIKKVKSNCKWLYEENLYSYNEV
ncbi:MAG: RNA-directed DNA polymerase [Clostridia bacterium]|nr:RNA-directed DNA polymerase [Clostridia bacterium]